MNLPDSLACEQSLGLGVVGERKEVFVPPPPSPPRSLLADALLMIKLCGYWLSFFCFAFLWTETKSKSIITLKKDGGQLKPSYLDRTSLVNKNILCGRKETLWKPQVVSNDVLFLPAR